MDESSNPAVARTSEGPARPQTEFALVFAGNEGVASALAVAICSTLVNLTADQCPPVFVLDNGLSESSRSRLQSAVDGAGVNVELHWVVIPAERLRDLWFHPRWTVATNARLLIPELLPQETRRVVYLDADVLVVQNVFPLFTVDLGGAPLGAVSDFLDRSSPYFNAGVLAIDLAMWRRIGVADRALKYGAANGCESQDALNATVDHWYRLEYKWNVQHGNLFFAGLHGLAEPRPLTEFTYDLYQRRWALYRNAAILHFTGGVKPWDQLCPLPGTTRWVFALARTGWDPPLGAVARLLRYILSRTRYWLGITRRRWRKRLDRGSGRTVARARRIR